jgi:hypothetical protein
MPAAPAEKVTEFDIRATKMIDPDRSVDQNQRERRLPARLRWHHFATARNIKPPN